MPNTRVPSGTTLDHPVRHIEDVSTSALSAAGWFAPMSAASPTWTADSLKNLAALTTRNLTATYGLWLEMVGNQQRFTLRLLDAMSASTKAEAGTERLPKPSALTESMIDVQGSEHVDQRAQSVREALQPAVAGSTRRPPKTSNATSAEFPIKRYDKLTVQEIAGKLERLRDHGQIRTVLAYEAKNKGRKGVIAVGEARLKRLTDH